MPSQEEFDRLRDELAEWRRRAEVAEAIATERLARAETAERALRSAEASLSVPTNDGLPTGVISPLPDPPPAPAKRPASLIERWRRYTDTLN